MALDTGIIPQQLEGDFIKAPDLQLPSQDLNILDIVNPSFNPNQGGIGGLSNTPALDPVESGLNDFLNKPTSASYKAAPTFFDYDASQANRYTSSKNFSQLGFDPNLGQENEYKYGARQTWGDVWSNGLTGMFKIAGNTYIEGWKGWAKIADAISSWDSNKLIGTPEELMAADKETKDIMNKYAIYATPESEQSGAAGIFNKKFFGDMLQQSGFAIGTIGQFLTEELITFGLSTEFSLAKLGLKEASWAGKIVTKADVMKDMVNLGDSVWKQASFAEKMVMGARKLVPYADTIYTMNKYGRAGAGALQIATIGVGGLRRLLSESNMAMTEARMESAGTYADLYTKLYDEELHKTGEAPDPLLVSSMKKNAMDAAHDNFWVNTGILMVSNRIQFDNVFSKFTAGRKVLGDGVGEFAEDVLEVSGKKAVKKGVAETSEEALTKVYQKGKFGTLGLAGEIAKDFGVRKAAWEVSKSLGKGMFKWEVDEGLQELFQDVSNNTLQNYYYDLYHGKKGSDLFDKSLSKAVDQEANMQGLKTFLMGAVTGRLISPINFAVGQAKLYGGTTALERKVRKADVASQIKLINAFYENPNRYLNEHIANIKVQNKAAQNMQEAIGNADQYVFTNNKKSAFAKMVSAAIKTDMIDSVIDTLRSYGQAFDEKQFKEAFGLEKTNDNIKSVNDFFSKIADETVEFHKTWKDLKSRFGDKVMLDLYREGSPERKTALIAKRALDDAIEMLATNDYKAKNATVRGVKLQNKMASIPVIGSSAAISIRTLGVMQNTQLEIDLLKQEIANTEALPQKDKSTRDLLKVKKDQLKSLEDWVLHSKDLNNMTRGNKRKALKARKAFENYINSKNAESKIDTIVKTDDIQDMYETILDYIDLNQDHKDYIDAYNVLANPIQFVNVHRRLMEAMNATAQKFAEEHREEIKKELDDKNPKNPKDPKDPESETHIVKLDEDGTYSIVSPKGAVVAKEIKTEEEANQQAKELDDLLAKDKDRPDGLPKEDNVIESKNGFYLIESIDKEGTSFYSIVDKKNNPITETTLNEKEFPSYDPMDLYDTLDQAKKIFDALVDTYVGDFKEYTFDGKTIKYEAVLVDGRGRKYKVLTKREPKKIKGVPAIAIQPLSGTISTTTITKLNDLRLESEFEPASKPENPNAIRIVRNNELVRIYPKKNSFDEDLTVAEDRLKKLINETPKDQLSAGISIRISKNQNVGEPSIWQEGKQDENRHIHLNPETHMVEIMYNGETIGFATFYNRYTYLSDDGKRTSIDAISKEQFQKIFNVKNKDVNDEFTKFKKNHAQSREFFTALLKQLGNEDSVTLSPEETGKLFNFTPSSGEYAFTEVNDPVISLNDVDFNTIEGETYIIDRRTKYLGNGMYEEDPRIQTSAGVIGDKKKSIEDKINAARFEGGEDKLRNYGRYVAAVEMPNGSIKFIELQSAPMEKDELTSLVEKMNEVSKKLKENNLEEKTDAKTKAVYFGARDINASANINAEINDGLYIAIPGRRGMRVNLSMTPTGNIRVEFATFRKGDKSPVKRDIILMESSADGKKPLNIKDANDLIERINRGIADHDANDKNILKKVGITVTTKSFKRSLSETADIDEYRQMISGVNKSVTKNAGIFFSVKKNQLSPTSVVINTNPTQAGSKPSGNSTEVIVPNAENIQVDPAEVAKMAEMLRQRKEQMKKKNIETQLLDLSNKRNDLIEVIQRELLQKGMSRTDTMKYNYATDPRIQEVDQEIAKLNNGTALKVSEKLSNQDITNINDFNTWLKQSLPEFISAEEFRNINRQMKKQGITVGMFYMHMNELNGRIEGKVAVTKDGGFKFHEAFHAVFRMLLSDEQIDILLNEAKKELKQSGKSIETLKKELYASKPEFYSRLTDKQLEERVYEEYLADKFEDWKNNSKVKTSPENKSWFRKLLDFIVNFFKKLKQSPIDDLFMNIEKGSFRNSSAILNRFTSEVLNVGIAEPALKAIKIGTTLITNEDGETERIPKYLSQQEGDILASTIAAIYHRRMAEAGLRTHNEDILDNVIADYQELYDLESNSYYESDAFIDRYNGSAVAINKARESIKEKYRLFSNPELVEEFKKSVKEHTKLMGYQEKEDTDFYDDQVDEYGDRVTTDNWKETYSIGGYGSLSKELRQYLGTIVDTATDEFGNTKFVNGEPFVEAANANVLYNGILKAVSGSVSQEQTLDRLRIFAEHNPEARKFWNKFVADVDMQFDENGNFVDIKNTAQATLFQAVVKGFSQFSVDSYFINKDIGKGEVVVMEANRKGAAKNQFSIWYNAFLRKFGDEYDVVPKTTEDISKFMNRKTQSLEDLATILKKGNNYTEDQLKTNLERIILDIRNELGINLSPLFLKFSYLSKTEKVSDEDYKILKAFEGVEPMTEEDAREITTIIKAGKNPFGTNIDPDKLAAADEQITNITNYESPEEAEEDEEDKKESSKDVNDDVDSAIGRLTKIAGANSIFDEQVSTTSYKNAKGELVYSHQLPTFNLVRGAELQKSEFRDELKKDKFLSTNFLLNNPLFEYIADTFKVASIDGAKDSTLSENDNGKFVENKQLNTNQNSGVTYGSMSDREFLVSLFDLYTNNKKHVIPKTDGKGTQEFMTSSVLLGVLEASNTGNVVNLPIIRSVEYKDQKIKLTSEMSNALMAEVKREYDRITRVEEEINGEFPNGVIEGYHNGDERGLKFIKMGNMLGANLSEKLINAARGNEDISQYKDEITQQIEKYWLGKGGKLDQMIESLVKQNIIRRVTETNKAGETETKLVNNLLSDSIFFGFKKNGKYDVDRNRMLNMIAQAPVYNIAQIMMNNYLNTLSVRQLFIGDAAEVFKNDGGIDEVKRNKGLNGSGASIDSIITSKELGIEHANKTSYGVTFEDPLYKGKFAGKNKEKADAQMYITEKFLRYTLFGLGKLNQAQAELLNKIKRGESVNSDDIFGEKFRNVDRKVVQKGGSIEFNAQTNSIKLVYSDGKKYVKVSGIMLSKQLTSIKENGQWVPRPGSEELHKLREKLEDFENKNQTITFGIPKSASKGVKKNVASSIADINTNNFIEHDNRFWRLQLENPSNKTIITDPTQAKQLIIAEQSRDLLVNFRGQEMSLGEVIDNYLKDTEQRVQNNYYSARKEMFDIEGAFGELRKSLKQNQITPKLGKFLSKAVETLASTGADSQLVEFFTPLYNPQTGEYTQKYNLNHPITLDKFTQLFLAHYSKGVMSEKVPGHALALMSNYGMKVAKKVLELDENGQPKRWVVIRRDQYEANRTLLDAVKNAKRWNNDLDREFEGLSVGDIYIDDLRHNVPEYDENGNITGYFTEYMTAAHFREHMNIGSDQAIPESALKAFAVRIPSDDKHSFVTTKLVDFLPANYGSTAVFPHELIEISGADFDIDKVYMQIMDSYRKDGELIPYGTAKTDKEKFQEYLIYMASRDRNVKDKLKELSNIGVTAEDPDNVIGYLEPNISYESIDQLANDLLKKDMNALLLENALKELDLPSTVDEYIKHVKTKGELNNGVLNNRILDAKIKMLNNEKMVLSQKGELPVAFQVAEVQPLKDAIDNFIARFPMLHDVLIEAGEDVDSMIGQYRAFKNNKEGARNIGPAVNAMLVFALMNAYGKQTKIRTKNGKGEDLYVLTIDGHQFDSYEHSRAYNNRKVVNPDGSVTDSSDYDGERIFYHIGAIVNAMTDNAKERLAARLGLNINAVGVVSNMVALGVPLETALMFNLQPAVREFYKDIAVTTNSIKTSFERKLVKKNIGIKLLEKLEEAVPDGVSLPDITTSLLENNIKSNGSNPEANLAIFKSFFEFYNQTEYYSDVAQVLKLSKGLGTSNENIDKIDQKEEKLGLNLGDADFANSKIPFDLRQVLGGLDKSKPFHHITANYRAIKDQIKELQKSVFIEKTYMFKRLTDTVLANLYVNSKEKETFNKTLKRDIIAYLGIKAYMQYLKVNNKTIKLEGLDNALIYDASAVNRGEDFMDIIDTVKKIREKMPDNYFANKFLNIVPVVLKDINENKEYINPNTKGGINLAESNTWAKLDSYQQSKLEDSFLEIYSKDRKLALNLFNYLIVKDGGQFKSGSFIKFIPPAMFKEILDATANAHDLLKQDDQINNDQAYKDIFGMTAKEVFNEFTTLYSTNINNSFNIKFLNIGKIKDEAIDQKRPKGYTPEVVKTDKSENQPIPTKIVIDMFGGIRKAEMTLLEDEMGNQFMAETIATGKFDEDELEKLNYNKLLLKARGINTVNRPTETGENRYYLELPYTIKIETGDFRNKQTTYYKLKVIGKGKEAVKDNGLGNMIREVGENMILSSVAEYEKFDPTGSKKQWKAGGVTGEMPANIVLRKRTAKNSDMFDKLETLEAQIEKLDAQLAGIPSIQLEPPVQELAKDWGINVKIVGNKVIYYKIEKGKDIEYDAKGAKSPQELLNRLNKEYEESGGPAGVSGVLSTVEKISADETSDIKVPEVGGFQAREVTEEDANKFKKLIADRKKQKQDEIDAQKKKDDNNCPM